MDTETCSYCATPTSEPCYEMATPVCSECWLTQFDNGTDD